MSVSAGIVFLVFIGLAVYLALLNPQEVPFQLTKTDRIELPLVVFLLGSILIGAMTTAALTGFFSLRGAASRWRQRGRVRQEDKRRGEIEALFQEGENAYFSGRLGKARELFDKILAIEPRHGGALYRGGLLKRDAGDFSGAIRLHETAHAASPEDLKILYALAEDYMRAGQGGRAVEIYQRALEADHGSPAPLCGMRDYYLRNEDWENAYAAQKAVMQLVQAADLEKEQSRFGEIIYRKGQSLLQAGEEDAAAAEFKRAIREDPRALPAYVALGDIYLRRGSARKAVKTWRAGFAETGAIVCLRRIEEAHRADGDADAIEKMYWSAMQTAPGGNKEWWTLVYAAWSIERGEPERAAAALCAINGGPPPPRWRLLLATAYHAQGNTSGAWGALREIFAAVKQSARQYACAVCKAALPEWRDFCPHCRSWNSAVAVPEAETFSVAPPTAPGGGNPPAPAQ